MDALVTAPSPSTWKQSALILAGHGATRTGATSLPIHAHVAALRARGLFAEVQAGFWKEEPFLRDTLRLLESRQAYVVPVFTSAGYFTREIVPREIGGPGLRLCEPVGTHPAIPHLMAEEALRLLQENAIDPADACVLVIGHGSQRHAGSAKTTGEAAAALGDLLAQEGLSCDIRVAFLEQAPALSDWRELTEARDILLLPFLIASGAHGESDVPALLGIEPGTSRPFRADGRKLWYGRPLGADPRLADLILDRVRAAAPPEGLLAPRPAVAAFLAARLALGPMVLGEILVEGGGPYVLRHVEDSGRGDLTPATDPLPIAFTTADGRHRGLRGAPDLPRGWVMEGLSLAALRTALDCFYPAALATLAAAAEGHGERVPFTQSAARQPGIHKAAGSLDAAGIEAATAGLCQTGCLRHPLWPADAAPAAPDALLCPEACTTLLGRANSILGLGKE